jgi:predicted lipoprotein with Yx(FWY)xxD motif
MSPRIGLAIGLVSLLVVAGCGSSSSSDSSSNASKSSSPSSSTKTVDVTKTGAGTVLTGSNGRTLYLFEKDTSPKSMCAGECANDWPPLTTSGKPTAGSGVQAGMLGTTKRADGTEQVTYNGHPLYFFEGDKKAGQTAGQGVAAFGAEWYVLGTNGNKVEGHEAGDKSSSKSDSSGGSDDSSNSSGGSSSPSNPY